MRPIAHRAPGRAVVMALLALVAVVGLHGKLPTLDWGARSRHHDLVVVVVLAAVFIGLFVAVRALDRGGPVDAFVGTVRKVLVYFLGGGLLALAVAICAILAGHLGSGTNIRLRTGLPPLPSRANGQPVVARAASAGGHFPVVDVLFGILAAALLGAVLVFFRRGRAEPFPADEGTTLGDEGMDDLRDVLSEGRRALVYVDDARAAIIACYLAMESRLAKAGATRAISETPEELLARARGFLADSSGAARALTSLFYEARFSTHALAQPDKDKAEEALRSLLAELGVAVGADEGGV